LFNLQVHPGEALTPGRKPGWLQRLKKIIQR
jgi:hypothetical protein